MIFSKLFTNFHALYPFVMGIVVVSFGLFVLSRNLKGYINKIFLLFCFVCCLWLFGFSFMYISFNTKNAIFWSKVVYLGVCYTSALFYHYIHVFLEIKKSKTFLVAIYILSSAFFYLSLTNKLLNGVYEYYWGYYPRFGLWHPLFMLYIFIVNGYTLFLIFKKFTEKSISEIEHTRIKYVFIGFGVGNLVIINFFATYGINVYPSAHLYMAFLLGILAYTIIRHQLMGIEVIIKKTLVFAGLFAGVYAIVTAFTLLGQLAFEHLTGGSKWVSLLPSIFVIVLILRPLENFLIKITDKFLFQKKYDYKELLKTFTTEVLTVLDLNNLVKLTVANLSDIVKIESCGVLLFDETTEEYKLAASCGIKERNIVLSRDNTLATFLDRTRAYLSTTHQGKDSPLPKRIIDDMNKLKLQLAIPLVIHNDMIGILTVGKKKSDEEYTQDDMDILLPLARTLAIAISNAMVLAELGKTQAEAAQREKMAVIGTLSAGINHEICNPLGIARGQCEAFLLNVRDGLYKNKSEEELLEKARTIMQKVIRETDRATAITKRLSSFAKPSKGLYNENVDIRESIDEVLALVGYEMKLDKVGVENKVPKNLPHITGDKKQIEEVFFNLIRNSAQAIHEKGKISIKAHKDEDRIFIEIEDTGHGIPEEKMGQIFNPFYTTKEPGKGTGLGLFIVKQVIERNGGRIKVRSKEGAGTTFILEFPAAEKVKV